MKQFVAALCLALAASGGVISPAFAVTPAQEQAFIDQYRKAHQAKDARGMHALLHVKGADPQALDFYKMMITAGMDATLTSVTLAELTAEDHQRLANTKGPDGRTMKMTLKPVKKLVVKTRTKTASQDSTGNSESFVAEFDGKLVIPVPAASK